MEVWKLSVKNMSRKIYFWQWNNGFSWQGHRGKLNRKWLGWERNFYFLWFWVQDRDFKILQKNLYRRSYRHLPSDSVQGTAQGMVETRTEIRITDRSGPWFRRPMKILKSWSPVDRSVVQTIHCSPVQGHIKVRFGSDLYLTAWFLKSIQSNFLPSID